MVFPLYTAISQTHICNSNAAASIGKAILIINTRAGLSTGWLFDVGLPRGMLGYLRADFLRHDHDCTHASSSPDDQCSAQSRSLGTGSHVFPHARTFHNQDLPISGDLESPLYT